MQLFVQLLSSILQSVEVWFKKHALELFQYNDVLFVNRIELNSDLKAIAEMTVKHQSTTACQIVQLPRNFMHCVACQKTSCTSFSMLRELLVKDRHFSCCSCLHRLELLR